MQDSGVASNSDPFSQLESGEYVLLRGRFGGMAKWVWGGTFGLMVLAFVVIGVVKAVTGTLEDKDMYPLLIITPLMVVIGVVPWLRSGRYRLTNRRISYKPTVGAVKEIALTDIRHLGGMGDGKQGLTIESADTKIKIRNVTKSQRLWGAICLYRVPGMADALPDAVAPVSFVAVRGFRQTGRGRFAKGTLVLRPEKAFYLPDSTDGDALKEAMQALARNKVTMRAELPTAEYVERLSNVGDAQFDEIVGRLCLRLGGEELRPGALPGKIWPAKLSKAKTKVRLREGMKFIQGTCATASVTPNRAWLTKWGEMG